MRIVTAGTSTRKSHGLIANNGVSDAMFVSKTLPQLGRSHKKRALKRRKSPPLTYPVRVEKKRVNSLRKMAIITEELI